MNYDRFIEIVDRVPEKIRWLVISVVAIILILVYYIVLRLPAEAKLKVLQTSYETIQQDFAEKQAIANDLKDWEAQVQKLAGQLQEALSQLPEKVGYDTLIIAVPNIAKKNGLNLESFDLLAERPQTDYNVVPIKMALSGPYRGIGRFIQEIGEHPRIMKIGDISIKTNRKQSGAADALVDDTVSVTAELVTYRFAAQAPVVAGAVGGKK